MKYFLLYKDACMKDEQIDAVSKLLKSMSHPIRLKILCLLQDQELSVGEIRDSVKTTNANVSQHLNILRGQGIIDFRKDANFIYNRITDKRILELIQKMHVLFCPDN
ncbi:ArsR family transcriptional regulator [Desulfobulbus sp. Tol-SR]|nr:ArsR family transcriptional regulator [Desulfobulbus sp. Tol-SR]